MRLGIPEILALSVVIGSAAIAVVDPSYREHFSRIADAVIVGFWAWMQAKGRR